MSIVTAAILAWFNAAIVPVLVQFGGWLAAASLGLLGFLFSPTIRKYTIAAIAVVVLLGSIYFDGYVTGRSHVSSADICKDPRFTQLRLTGKFTPALLAWAKGHNDLGAALGCWDNSNIRY